jgi:hypothetical protein
MARTAKAKRKPRKHNPAAKAVRSRAFRPRIVKSKKAYSRRSRTEPSDA